jgi:hypothetical protein
LGLVISAIVASTAHNVGQVADAESAGFSVQSVWWACQECLPLRMGLDNALALVKACLFLWKPNGSPLGIGACDVLEALVNCREGIIFTNQRRMHKSS